MDDGRARADGGWEMSQGQFPYPGAGYNPLGAAPMAPPNKDVSTSSYSSIGKSGGPPNKDVSAIPGISSFQSVVTGVDNGYPPYDMGQAFYRNHRPGNGLPVPGYGGPSTSPLPVPGARPGKMPQGWDPFVPATLPGMFGQAAKQDTQKPTYPGKSYQNSMGHPGELAFSKIQTPNGTDQIKQKMAASLLASYPLDRNKMSPINSAQGLMNFQGHHPINGHLPSAAYHGKMNLDGTEQRSTSSMLDHSRAITPNGLDKKPPPAYSGQYPKYAGDPFNMSSFSAKQHLNNGSSDGLHNQLPMVPPLVDGHNNQNGMSFPNPFYPAPPYVDPFLMKNYENDFLNNKMKNGMMKPDGDVVLKPKPKKRKVKDGENVGLIPKKKKVKQAIKEEITSPQLPSIEHCLGAELGVGEQSRSTEGLSPEIDDTVTPKVSVLGVATTQHNSQVTGGIRLNSSLLSHTLVNASVTLCSSVTGNYDPMKFIESKFGESNNSVKQENQVVDNTTPCSKSSPLCSSTYQTLSPELSSMRGSSGGMVSQGPCTVSRTSPSCTVTSSSVGSIPSVSLDSTAIKVSPSPCVAGPNLKYDNPDHSQQICGNPEQKCFTADQKLLSRTIGLSDNIGKGVTRKEEMNFEETKMEFGGLDLLSHEAEKENYIRNCMNGIPDLQPNGDGEKSNIDNLTYNHVQKLRDTLLGENDADDKDRLGRNEKIQIPRCNCRGADYVTNEDLEGPYYTQLGTGRSIQAVREMLEKRVGMTGKAIRMEKLRYTGREGKSTQGCPIAKWIVRRSSQDEKYLCLVRQRSGHFCETACIVVVVVAWEGIPTATADSTYDYLVSTLTKYGFETDRRCGTNDRKTCACQGVDLRRRGASFSFGCSWSMYFNGCKFARSRDARKFKLKDTSESPVLEDRMQKLATIVGPVYQKVAPDAYHNQTAFEKEAQHCRLGNEEGRPFSGVTACVDFCAHSHKDFHNMHNGSTVVVNLMKHRGLGKPDDEQLHVLPLYVMDMEDEHGSRDAQLEKIKNGSLECLQVYPMEMRLRSTPLTPNRKKKGKDKNSPGPGRKRGPKSAANIATPQSVQDVSKSPSDMYFNSQNSKLSDPGNKDSAQGDTIPGNKGAAQPPGSNPRECFSGKSFISYEDMMSLSSEPGFANLYESFWSYFYSYGTFPPPSFLNSWNISKDRLPQASSNAPPSGNTLANNSAQGCNQPHSTSWQQNGLDLSKSGSEQELQAAIRGTNQEAQPLADNPAGQRLCQSTPGVKRDFSPLDLLSEAVSIRAKQFDEVPHSHPSMQRPNSTGSLPSNLPLANQHRGDNPTTPHAEHGPSYQPLPYANQQHSKPAGTGADVPNGPPNTAAPPNVFNGFAMPFPSQESTSVLDPTVVKCEMEYNENAFTDPTIGGVAIALCHGAVLFEVAKRELHATTGLRNPDRYAPTRISLVFYQHKNLNHAHHGMYEYERKLEGVRQKRLEKLKEEANGTMIEIPELPVKGGKKKKGKKSETVDIMETSAAKYKYMWEVPIGMAESRTTNSVITRWIDPQPMVTGPYQRWV